MTLGERIASMRKEKGLSQEALGELVGVSRQAVSKWEADRAVPDVNNCIAMSRTLGVSLARLLDLEEEMASAPAELDERHMRLVERLTERYEAERRRIRRRWRWPLILTLCALTVGLVWMWEWLSGMSRTIDYLSGEMATLQGDIVSGVGDRVRRSMEEESSLITDYAIHTVEADLASDTLTYEITCSLKEGGEDTSVSFMARSDGKQYTAPAERENGLVYQGRLSCPIRNDTAVYLLVEEDGRRRSQTLDTLYSADDYRLQIYGAVNWGALYQNGLREGAFEPMMISADVYQGETGLPEPLRFERLEVGVFRNDRREQTTPVDLSKGNFGFETWNLLTDCDISFDPAPFSTGDTLTFAILGEDNYGRKASYIVSRYRVLEGGKAEDLSEEASRLNDGTYGTEEW